MSKFETIPRGFFVAGFVINGCKMGFGGLFLNTQPYFHSFLIISPLKKNYKQIENLPTKMSSVKLCCNWLSGYGEKRFFKHPTLFHYFLIFPLKKN